MQINSAISLLLNVNASVLEAFQRSRTILKKLIKVFSVLDVFKQVGKNHILIRLFKQEEHFCGLCGVKNVNSLKKVWDLSPSLLMVATLMCERKRPTGNISSASQVFCAGIGYPLLHLFYSIASNVWLDYKNKWCLNVF